VAIVNLPDSTVARSALAHDAADSEVAESLLAQPESVSDAATATAIRIPKRFFTLSPNGLMAIAKEYSGLH
jgi:hypothetical protein